MWMKHYRLAAEFLAFFLCIAFMAFCIVYYQEYEKKSQAQRKNQIIEITVQQQAKEIEAIRKCSLETTLLRHDLRHLLTTLAASIEQNDREHALNLISGYVAQVESAALHRYCQNDTINYILSNFESKCHNADIVFHADLQLQTLSVDEVMFASIISNALDNALNAQLDLPPEERQIKFMLKHSNGKLLFSVKNPYNASLHPLTWVNQLPASTQKGHGYGTQSILYLTEKLGGKCQFVEENNMFVLRVII